MLSANICPYSVLPFFSKKALTPFSKEKKSYFFNGGENKLSLDFNKSLFALTSFTSAIWAKKSVDVDTGFPSAETSSIIVTTVRRNICLCLYRDNKKKDV